MTEMEGSTTMECKGPKQFPDVHRLDELEAMVASRTVQLAQANECLEQDIQRREAMEAELVRRNAELTELNAKLSMTQQQLMQSEKLASIGQLAAGVAHEINNPIGYVLSNFVSLEKYCAGVLEMLGAYQAAEASIAEAGVVASLRAVRERVDMDFLMEDIPLLMAESKEGIDRVRRIVQDLKDFSRIDSDQEWQWAHLHHGIDSTLNIVSNEVKYKADVVKEYGAIPEIECLPTQINQVIMNIVVNAAHAISAPRGLITIRTGTEDACVRLEIADNGSGIPREIQSRIFDPFFTTKEVGQGTGLGLSITYGIVKEHQGSVTVKSTPGAGTCFTVRLPLYNPTTMSSKHALGCRHEDQESSEGCLAV